VKRSRASAGATGERSPSLTTSGESSEYKLDPSRVAAKLVGGENYKSHYLMDRIPFHPACLYQHHRQATTLRAQDCSLALCLGAELVTIIFKRSVAQRREAINSKIYVAVVVKFDDMLNATAGLR